MKPYRKLFVVAGSLLFLLLLFVGTVKASPLNNPIFATIEQVQQMINNATFHQKELRVYDNNNNELGLYMQGDFDNLLIFVESVGKIVQVQGSSIIPQDNFWFVSNDCTGTPLVQTALPSDHVLTVNHQFYIVNTDTVVARTTNSVLDGQPLHCDTRVQVTNFYEVTPITLPFSDPLVSPLHIKYQ